MKEKILKWFAGGFGAASGVTFSALLAASPGDVLTQQSAYVEISETEAQCMMDCAIEHTGWSGDKAGIIEACVANNGVGYSANINGHITMSVKEVLDAKKAGKAVEIVATARE